jgi:molybdopterin converting factor subunit 1
VRVRIRLFAAFREAVGQSELTRDVPAGVTASQVVAQLHAEFPSLGPAVENAMLAVNQDYVSPDVHLHDGDELALIPPVSGG